jgi:protein-S-isoprenylcysteine O-methyltransferase Ste14
MITSIHFEDDTFFLILTDCLLLLNVCIRVYYFYETFDVKTVRKYRYWIFRILAFVSWGSLLVCLALYHMNILIFNNDTFCKYTQFNFPVWLRWFGAVLLLAANVFFYIVHYYLDRSWSSFVGLL